MASGDLERFCANNAAINLVATMCDQSVTEFEDKKVMTWLFVAVQDNCDSNQSIL